MALLALLLNRFAHVDLVACEEGPLLAHRPIGSKEPWWL
jgi:hypothetical protein